MIHSRKHPLPLDETDGHCAAKQFLTVLFEQLEKHTVPEDKEYDLLHRIATFIKEAPGTPNPTQSMPPAKPAARFWNQVLKQASGDGSTAIVSALHRLEPFISWINEPNYRNHELMDTFRDIYACFEVVGANGFFMHDRVTIGVMLLGPDFFYPSHSHPDYECIYAFSGRSTWHMNDGPIISIPAGARIFIPPNKPHIFWTMDKPFAGIYLCLKP